MENKNLTNPQNIQIQGLLDRYLRSQAAGDDLSSHKQHLDEDLLAAFTEGNLSEREAKPIISHLINCSFCRNVTAELVKLDLAFAGETVQPAVSEDKPSRISEVLGNLLSNIFGTDDGAVFAHQEKEENSEEAKDIKDEEK